jgi:hypothetical protein
MITAEIFAEPPTAPDRGGVTRYPIFRLHLPLRQVSGWAAGGASGNQHQHFPG